MSEFLSCDLVKTHHRILGAAQDREHQARVALEEAIRSVSVARAALHRVISQEISSFYS
jgi:hypothetical protein